MKSILTLVFLTIIHFTSVAQWEGGFLLGGSNYIGDLTPDNIGDLSQTSVGGGLYIKNHFNKNIALNLGLNFIRLKGDDPSQFSNRAFTFTNQLAELSLSGDYYPFGNKMGSTKKIAIAPYISAGGLIDFVNIDVDHRINVGNKSQEFKDKIGEDLDKIESLATVFGVPIGGGIDFVLKNGLRFGVNGGYRYMFTDLLDGVAQSGNPDKPDSYYFFGAKVGFLLGDEEVKKKKEKVDLVVLDKDGDGIIDSKDSCPDVAGIAKLSGCPDTDEDGVADADDECPDEKGSFAANGCPDADQDGITDKEDKCPNEKGIAEYGGCPNDPNDIDGDGVPNNEDECPDQLGTAQTKGCPDTDGDGVADKDDKCPDENGGNNGCPEQDTDGDGIPDAIDKCPDSKGVDGSNGCPKLKRSHKKVLDNALENVQFGYGTATLLPESYPALNAIVNLMKKSPEYHLEIRGHSDNTGADNFNQKLSEARAKSCYLYLKLMGVNMEKVKYKGFGEYEPIETNDTEEGRQLNRRAEFQFVNY